ncbi:hypothetical protein HDU98_006531 [Podochytrium sp. JEL0797]|nr:hypothetical protein HDU98_006531 [Podochytrium sp. JEL0797]
MSASHNQKRSTVSQSEAETAKTQLRIQSYRNAWGVYLDAKAADRLNLEGLQATTAVLEINPEAYSAWNFRRRVLLAVWGGDEMTEDGVQASAQADLKFIEKLVRVWPKSYWLWNHRRWVLENMPHPDWQRELKLCGMMLDLDPRNFHGWDYRRIVLSKVEMDVDKEVAYSMGKIEQNFSNFSAWHYRSKLVPRVEGGREREVVLERDFEVVRNAIYTEPEDQSAWLYQRWLLGKEEQPLRVVWSRFEKMEGEFVVLVCFNHAVLIDESKVTCLVNSTQPVQLGRKRGAGKAGNVYVTRVVTDGDVSSVRIEVPRDAFQSFVGVFFEGAVLVVDVGVESGLGSVEVESGHGVREQSVWTREIESVRELVEVEPEAKWALTALVYMLMNQPCGLNGEGEKEVERVLRVLGEVDAGRKGVYEDLGSDVRWRGVLGSVREDMRELRVVDPEMRLTRIVEPWVLGCGIAKVEIVGQKLTRIPGFPCVRELVLDGNLITGWEGVEECFLVRGVSLRWNRVKELRGCKGVGVKEIWVEGNEVERGEVEGVVVHY